MSRRRPASGATISLFPFLAVLLCTMGALLVLLVIFSRRAHESESAGKQAAEQARAEELALARDEIRWRLEQLRGVREKTAADLVRERMRLAGIEEDARKLADELEVLERTAVALAEASAAPEDDAVADAERRLATARAALDAAREAGAKKPAAYAVVPYEGANGTHRRPLYVECCIDGVFLQPEGIRLGPGDFEGPPGPGNPLASALRSAREHIARNPGESGDPAAQPYPLLLVRPSGVMAYYAAREALTSWGSEFGYQFVDEEWQLTYPPADPALAAVEERAIAESRRRMEWLAQVRPARPARPTQQYRASTTRGGVVAEGGPSVIGDQSRFDWTEEQAAVGGSRTGGGGDGRGEGADSGGGDVVLGGGGRGGAAGGRGGEPGGAVGVPGTGSPSDRYAGPSRFYSGQPVADGSSAAGTGGAGGPHADGTATRPAAGTARSAGGSPGGGGPGGMAATDAAGATQSGTAGGSGGSAGASMAAAGMSGGSAGAGSGGAAGGPALPGMMQGAGASAGGAASGSASGSLAGARGSNWASLATAERPIPVTRPIRVECAANEFRIFDDSGTRVETRIPIGTRTADSVDPLVQAVHGRVGGWGLAGERMYWRPELVLSEAAGGQSRREDLERLLADSGLDTRRDSHDMEVRLLPPVTRTTATGLRR